jgi:hypothetical protein
MKFNISFFTDENFRFRENLLLERYQNMNFDNVFVHTSEEIRDTDFYKEFKHILDQPKGAGYCLWKPYIILEDLNKMDDGDVLVYLDASDNLVGDGLHHIKIAMDKRDYYISNWRGARNKQREKTKKDCFVLMDCDNEFFHNFPQVEAGFVIFKKNQDNVNFINQWLNYCKNENILTDKPNEHGNNLPEFKNHLYDQSVLTNLVLKNNIKLSYVLKDSVAYNVVPPSNTHNL